MPNWLPIGSGSSTVSRSSAASRVAGAQAAHENIQCDRELILHLLPHAGGAQLQHEGGMSRPVTSEKVPTITSRPKPTAVSVRTMTIRIVNSTTRGASSSSSMRRGVAIVTCAIISVRSSWRPSLSMGLRVHSAASLSDRFNSVKPRRSSVRS